MPSGARGLQNDFLIGLSERFSRFNLTLRQPRTYDIGILHVSLKCAVCMHQKLRRAVRNQFQGRWTGLQLAHGKASIHQVDEGKKRITQ
jgi:hypothetical protein